MVMKIEVKLIGIKPVRVPQYIVKRINAAYDWLLNLVPGGTKHYYGVKGWQRSCRPHRVKSRVRHAKRKAACGYRYKGGK